ncbi:MAG: amidohydrolase family protein [Alphaproteobacteria bacterium]|nr:amidohydrolase family protein [Alphaproteobacteria bacterium]
MTGILKAALLGVTALGTGSQALADVTVIHAGELLAVPGEAAKKNQTVVIEDGRIREVREGFVDAANFGDDATLVDLKESFVMPGLMDMHVHIQGELGPRGDSEKLRMSAEDVGMRSVQFAHRTLMAGFTTVRDLGASSPQHVFSLRKASANGWVDAPRIVAAGSSVAATGGHGDVDGMRHDLLEKYTSKTICDGGEDCLRAVRHAVKYGADVIKITATGGVLSDTNTGTGQQMTDDELKTIMDAAHALGRKVAAHAHAAEGINAALRAGVDSIEHGSYADAESIRLFKKGGAYLVPTLLAGATVVNMAKTSDFMPPDIKEKALRVGADLVSNFQRSYKAGVKIAYGTDSGVSKHGTNADEALLMAKAGMPAMEILKTATVNAADLIGMSDSLGTIEAGKHADIIAMHGNPINDLNELLDVDFVMKGGKTVKNK